MQPQNVPTVEITLAGDRPRRIAFTLGAMRRIKTVTGHSVGDDAIQLAEIIGAYIWAMLVKEDRKDVTVEDIEDMIHPGNLDEIIAAFNAVVSQGVPEGKVVAVPVEVSPQT